MRRSASRCRPRHDDAPGVSKLSSATSRGARRDGNDALVPEMPGAFSKCPPAPGVIGSPAWERRAHRPNDGRIPRPRADFGERRPHRPMAPENWPIPCQLGERGRRFGPTRGRFRQSGGDLQNDERIVEGTSAFRRRRARPGAAAGEVVTTGAFREKRRVPRRRRDRRSARGSARGAARGTRPRAASPCGRGSRPNATRSACPGVTGALRPDILARRRSPSALPR